jgi:DNA-binding NtrC family response regulator
MESFTERFSLLIVDDESQMRKLLGSVFSDTGFNLSFAADGSEAVLMASKTRIDAALVDLVMPGMNGLEVLKEIRGRQPETMVVLMTGQGGIKDAVEAIQLGAADFLEKPFSPEALQARMLQLFRIWELNRENRHLKSRLQNRFGYSELVGNSTAMLKLKETIAQVGPSDATILIQGETGTGKELVARAIHHHSSRSRNSFVPVDCGAISQTVMESELFGHAKGAFTGAHISTLGLIRSADKGTLFLDEVGDLPPAIQVKLLRAIQQREVRPVGDSKAYPVDVRVLAATHRNLHKEVAEGRFREDLFFRLNVLTINVPPLRDRTDDISLLANYFLERFASTTTPVRVVTRETLEVLERYPWPGNVRELENTIRRSVALGARDAIRPEDLPETIYSRPAEVAQREAYAAGDSMAAFEIAAIRNALAKGGGNRARAARILGIGEATLYRKIKKYKIEG